MSEEQAQYLTDANEMMGKGYDYPSVEIEAPSKKQTRRVRGEFQEESTPAWIKFSTAFKEELPDISGTALKVWIFIALSVDYRGDAFPSIRTIAAGIGMSTPTVIDAIKELEVGKLLTVNRENGRHSLYKIDDDYVKVGRGEPVKKFIQSGGTVQDNKQTVQVCEANRVTGVYTNKKEQEDNKNTLARVFESANKTVDAILEWEKIIKYPHRDKIPSQYLALADTYNELTGQEPTKRVLMDWLSTLDEWNSEGIGIADLREAYKKLTDRKDPVIISRPGSLTNTAAAIHAQNKQRHNSSVALDPFASLNAYLAQTGD